MLEYPKINIRSSNELWRSLERKTQMSAVEARKLVAYCRKNKDLLWRDHPDSEPQKGKFIRTANPKNYKRFLSAFNKVLLKPYDGLLPEYIYGGLSGKSSIQAARSILGKGRSLLSIDLKRFYEQVTKERIAELLYYQCGCRNLSYVESLADLFCVSNGPKENPLPQSSIARGFPTSPRLAVWASYRFALELGALVKKRLYAYHPRLMFYIDDIGITALQVPLPTLKAFEEEAYDLGRKHGFDFNESKTELYEKDDLQEILGVSKLEGRYGVGLKSREKRKKLREELQAKISPKRMAKIQNSLRGLNQFEKDVRTKPSFQ